MNPEPKHVASLVGLLEKKDDTLLREVLKILCNMSNSENGKKVLVQCNLIPHLNRLLQNHTDSAIHKFAVACLANIATAVELKQTLAENGCLIHVLQAFQQGIENADAEIVKYGLYFVGNVCEDYPEAAYVFGRLLVMQHLAHLLNSKLSDELLPDVVDVLYVLLRIKENLYAFLRSSFLHHQLCITSGGEKTHSLGNM